MMIHNFPVPQCNATRHVRQNHHHLSLIQESSFGADLNRAGKAPCKVENRKNDGERLQSSCMLPTRE